MLLTPEENFRRNSSSLLKVWTLIKEEMIIFQEILEEEFQSQKRLMEEYNIDLIIVEITMFKEGKV